MEEILNLLGKLNINYNIISHKEIYTVDEAQSIFDKLDGIGCKNLFIKNKKNYYLYILPDKKQINLNKMCNDLGIQRVHFASEEDLYDIMKLRRGSVTPLGIINDVNHIVTIIIDKDIIDKNILVHPNINTSTISIKYYDLIKFINYFGNKIIYI